MRFVRLVSLFTLAACQDYPFELREEKRVLAKRIDEVVATLRPVDILFIVDNSGTMGEERELLKNNVSSFVEELAASSIDFQVGIITPDVDCNLPTRDCASGGTTALACCRLNTPLCADTDTDADGVYDRTNCDGGRLRSADGDNRIFTRPTAEERAQWVADFGAAITAVGCQGSSFESGLEAAVRAVECATDNGCYDPKVADLNAGFIREGADLVLIFLTDEDDCSFRDASVYNRVQNVNDVAELASQLCSPNECYAHYGSSIDTDTDNIMNWADGHAGSSNYFTCEDPATGIFYNRNINPPMPFGVNVHLNRLIDLKGDVARIRAAGIVSGFRDESAGLGFRSGACWKTVAGPSEECGCLSSSANNLFCELTALIRDGNNLPADSRLPTAGQPSGEGTCGGASLGGCEAMPTGRYVDFLRSLGERRQTAGVNTDVLIDSICQTSYQETLYRIVNNVIISNCFDLGQPVQNESSISVRLNGVDLPNVEIDSTLEGWSLSAPGSREICLEGGLTKNINDQFEIFVLDESGVP